MVNKNWEITFEFNQASASRHYQTTVVAAANIGLAVNRAWGVVKKRQGIKGKQHHDGKIFFKQTNDEVTGV